MKFLLDTMMGHMVTWLRLLGYDTLYVREASDDELIELSVAEKRVVVTRDKTLAAKLKKLGVKTVLLETVDTVETLAKIGSETGVELVFNPLNTRCPVCNTLLEHFQENREHRWICRGCGKTYWIGGHWRNITKVLEKVRATASGR
ncbi:conserved hypothetical protein [Candidatus Caldarchaeum subterraneum]|uniref:Mut7-C RNAse domain-containing protein n=1 Tax=Caldiarchaeum subterraneum TaxID=311458 RepID=E6N9C0_CALS0|nr:conserved hypothetical protein [Candidatus Caldarchaeum subterraneum]BAJ51510.1 conserved hypothetical protein [Candidatus Caldarchaeum subterraneum]